MLPFNLPADVWRLILSFLSSGDVARAGRVSRGWAELSYLSIAVSVPLDLVRLEVPEFRLPPSNRSRYGAVTRCEQGACEFAGHADFFGFCSSCIKSVPRDEAVRQRHLASWKAKSEQDAKAFQDVRHSTS